MILGRAVLGTLKAVLGAIYARASPEAGPVIADAYLEDFLVVPAGDRFLEIPSDDRWLVIQRADFIGVNR